MRDHTLFQHITRVNRPYENEEKDMSKPHGFVLDFVGIFEKLAPGEIIQLMTCRQYYYWYLPVLIEYSFIQSATCIRTGRC
jgi:hypothetical protein